MSERDVPKNSGEPSRHLEVNPELKCLIDSLVSKAYQKATETLQSSSVYPQAHRSQDRERALKEKFPEVPKRRVPKEAIFYILKDLRTYLENLQELLEKREDETTRKIVSEVRDVIALMERSIVEEDTLMFLKATMKLKNLDLYIMMDDTKLKDVPMVKFWEELIKRLKDDSFSLIDLKEFLEIEWQKLVVGIGIIQELSQLEQDPSVKKLIVETSQDAFRHYYFALNNLTRYLKERDKSLLDGILDDIYYATWFMLKLRSVLPEEFEEELRELLSDEV